MKFAHIRELTSPQSNALQVELGVVVESGLIVMPAGLRGYEVDHEDPSKDLNDIGTCTMMALPELQLQLRTHDYYMGMPSAS